MNPRSWDGDVLVANVADMRALWEQGAKQAAIALQADNLFSAQDVNFAAIAVSQGTPTLLQPLGTEHGRVGVKKDGGAVGGGGGGRNENE